MQVVILAGGVGGSRFVAGARQAFPDADITVVVNTADDITLYGLRICPDLDTMMYALGRRHRSRPRLGPGRGELADPRRADRLRRRPSPGSGSATTISAPTCTAPSCWPTG